MSDDDKNLLRTHLEILKTPVVAVLGEPARNRREVLEICKAIGLSTGLVNVQQMPGIEEIQRQRSQAPVIDRALQAPSFIRAFLEVNGLREMPEVLILDRFNYRPAAESYFIKSFLELNSREKDECFQSLRTIILFLGKLGADGTYSIDPDIQGCISLIVETV